MIPKQIKVGAITYKVEEKETVIIRDNKNYLGSCNYDKQEIEIMADLGKQRKEDVFIHELTHAIFEGAGYDEQDEDQVNRIGKVLYQVLKDNQLSFD